MTKNKARKRLVRTRAERTGESYTTALRQLRTRKENAVSTPTEPRPTLCALCAAEERPDESFVVAGLVFCPTCHDRLHAAVRSHLEPEAARTRRPLEYFVSALVFAPDQDGWVVHLHTLQPGLVVGQKGATATRIRQSLTAVKGDDRLRLNIVPHEVFGCPPRPKPS